MSDPSAGDVAMRNTGAAGTSDAWTIQRVLAWASKDLRAKASPSPRLDSELMLAWVLGCDRIKLIMEAAQPLSKEELGRYRELHKRRRLGEPIAYLRGHREFYGRRFAVDARVLVPRPETETLVECAMRRTKHLSLCARVLDMCTGSGCVAITLKKQRPTTTVYASDVSKDALDVARKNALQLGASIALLEADLYRGLDSLAGRLDLITANPPYIDNTAWLEMVRDIRDFEPQLALSAGDDALSLTRPLVAGATRMLVPGGVLAVETMAGSAPHLVELMKAANFCDVEIDKDYGGHERVVSGRRSH